MEWNESEISRDEELHMAPGGLYITSLACSIEHIVDIFDIYV